MLLPTPLEKILWPLALENVRSSVDLEPRMSEFFESPEHWRDRYADSHGVPQFMWFATFLQTLGAPLAA